MERNLDFSHQNIILLKGWRFLIFYCCNVVSLDSVWFQALENNAIRFTFHFLQFKDRHDVLNNLGF